MKKLKNLWARTLCTRPRIIRNGSDRTARVAALGRLDGEPDDALVARLGEHIADVEVDGALCDAELCGDFLVAHVAADALQDLELAARQLGIRASKGGGAADIRIDLCAFIRYTKPIV